MECYYCKHWQTAKKRHMIKVSENMKISHRYCEFVGELIKGRHGICDNFVMSPIFWCDEWNAFMFVTACRARQAKRAKDCTDCPQGWDVIHLASRHESAVQNAPKLIKRKKGPSLIKRKKEPQLIKRRK